MNIDRFKDHHVRILRGIARLREWSRQGIAEHAVEIANELKTLSRLVIQHLAIEDRILYPSLEKGEDAHIARMSRTYREDMKGIAGSFIGFSRRWSDARVLKREAADFRAEANVVLKRLHERMLRENREFYPAIEALQTSDA